MASRTSPEGNPKGSCGRPLSLPASVASPRADHDGTIDAALRAAFSDEVGRLVATLTSRSFDAELSGPAAALDGVHKRFLRVEAEIQNRPPAGDRGALRGAGDTTRRESSSAGLAELSEALRLRRCMKAPFAEYKSERRYACGSGLPPPTFPVTRTRRVVRAGRRSPSSCVRLRVRARSVGSC